MKALLAFSLCVILFACSPKFQIRNGDGFGSGGTHQQSLNTLGNHLDLQKNKNDFMVDSQILKYCSFDQENYTQNRLNDFGIKVKAYKENIIKKSSLKAIKESRFPKLKISLTQKLFRKYLQKKAEVDNSMVDIFYKVFIIALVCSGALIVFSVFFLFSGSWYAAESIFIAGYSLGIFALLVGLLTLILWLATM